LQSSIEETNGAELVAGGTTKLKEQLKKLEKGGVLFIDEAYQLDPIKSPLGAQVYASSWTAFTSCPSKAQQSAHNAAGSPGVVSMHWQSSKPWIERHDTPVCSSCPVASCTCTNRPTTQPHQVLNFLLPEMENKRGKLVLVLAGYRKPMEETIMAFNEGLSSRFPLEFTFPDYTDDQLLSIFKGMLEGTQPVFKLVDAKYARIAARRWVWVWVSVWVWRLVWVWF
jgi:hypothetical protein